jgi:phasin family protein
MRRETRFAGAPGPAAIPGWRNAGIKRMIQERVAGIQQLLGSAVGATQSGLATCIDRPNGLSPRAAVCAQFSGGSSMEKPDAANPFGDFTKMLEQFKLPGFDVPAIMEARRKDVEALVTANQTAFQGMQSLAQKQAEMLRTTLSEIQALAGQMTAAGGAASPQAAELVQQTLHKTLANMQQLAQAAYQSQAESYAVIQKRVEENVEELRTLLQQKK